MLVPGSRDRPGILEEPSEVSGLRIHDDEVVHRLEAVGIDLAFDDALVRVFLGESDASQPGTGEDRGERDTNELTGDVGAHGGDSARGSDEEVGRGPDSRRPSTGVHDRTSTFEREHHTTEGGEGRATSRFRVDEIEPTARTGSVSR